MKKAIGFLLIPTLLLLAGCGIIEETKKTINYATETTTYINELSTFAEEAQTMANSGDADLADVETKLTELEKTITDFNSIEAPEIAEGIHKEILIQNEKLLDTINKIQSGELTIEDLSNTDFSQSINEITEFMDQIKNMENE
jgi:Family of unknown function (DUF6376)